MTQPFRENPKLAKSLHMANKILTGLVFIAYPCLLLWMLWHKDPRLTNAIIYPMNGFICVTVVRAILLLVCAAGIAVIRVISGVHSISDVVAAAACALLFSGYFF